MAEQLPGEYLSEVRKRCEQATKGLWLSMIEGRDHSSGGSFIARGVKDSNLKSLMSRKEEDLYLTGGTNADQDFIANARQDIPILLDEIERLQILLKTLMEHKE